MIAAAVSLWFNADALTEQYQEQGANASAAVAAAVLHSCEPYVPYDTGALCRSGHTTSSGPSNLCTYNVVWDMPYAEAVYYGDQRGVTFYQTHHPHATARWVEKARVVCAPQWTQTAADAFGE